MLVSEKVILELLGYALFEHEPELPEDISWDEVYKEAKNQTVFLLVYDVACKIRILPKNVERIWLQTSIQYIYQNEILLMEQNRVLNLLKKAGISCAVLKGSASAASYRDPNLRIMGDIDLLVDPTEQLSTVKVLQQEGYGDILDEDHHCHFTIKKEDIYVEIHKEPNGLFINRNSLIEEKFNNLFNDALDHIQYSNDIPMLSDYHHALVLILHKLEHFLIGGLGLRQLCDWAAFVNIRMSSSLWSILEPQLAALGLLYFTGIITRSCIDFLHLPVEKVPWAMKYDAKLAEEVMQQILAYGNFGIKEQLYGQRFFTDVHSANRLSSFFHVTISACKQHWPKCKKYPLLLPIAPMVST